MQESTNRAEAERLLKIAEKLLHGNDLYGSRDFAMLAQETEPLLEGSDQILAVIDVLVTSEKRINNHNDWYAILQLDRRSDDLELIKKNYRRLALLLHPDKNNFPLADAAFKLVADAWAVLSNPAKKSLYDNELIMFSKFDQHDQQKSPVRRSSWAPYGSGTRHGDDDGGGTTATSQSSFWTACPYCYNLYEYPRAYEECCLRCPNCHRAFHGAAIPTLPPLVPGKDSYYCCWSLFPIRSADANSGDAKNAGLPNWTPPMFPATETTGATAPSAMVGPNDGSPAGYDDGFVDVRARKANRVLRNVSLQTGPRKRGRPRKNVFM